MNSRKVAVVTGSNKGIGYVIVKGLCEKFDGDVYLTSRDVGRGQAAVESLKKLGLNPLFHQLDISDQTSVDAFKNYIKKKHGGLDVLVNNAAISLFPNEKESKLFQAKEMMRINYYAVLRVCNALFPLLRQNGRVVNVSSGAGHLSVIKSENLRKKLSDKNLTIDGLNQLMEKYLQDVTEGKNEEEGWAMPPFAHYSVTKVGVCALTNIQHRLFEAETPNRNISINSVHPGYIETDMTEKLVKHMKGAKPVEEGAKAPLFLALEANLKGQFVMDDCSVVDWEASGVERTSNYQIHTKDVPSNY